jgi:hypothetical protein
MHHDLLSQLGRNYVGQSPKGRKHPRFHTPTQRLEQIFFSEKRHSSPNDDASGTE